MWLVGDGIVWLFVDCWRLCEDDVRRLDLIRATEIEGDRRVIVASRLRHRRVIEEWSSFYELLRRSVPEQSSFSLRQSSVRLRSILGYLRSFDGRSEVNWNPPSLPFRSQICTDSFNAISSGQIVIYEPYCTLAWSSPRRLFVRSQAS